MFYLIPIRPWGIEVPTNFLSSLTANDLYQCVYDKTHFVPVPVINWLYARQDTCYSFLYEI